MKNLLPLVILISSSCLQCAAGSEKFRSTMDSSSRTNKIDLLKKIYHTKDSTKLLHHVLANIQVTTEVTVNFYAGTASFSYVVPDADIIEKLALQGIDTNGVNSDGFTPFQVLHHKLKTSITKRLVSAILVKIALDQDSGSNQNTAPLIVNTKHTLKCNGNTIAHSTLVGNPFDDPNIMNLLKMLNPDKETGHLT